MDQEKLLGFFAQTLEDRRLSRGERQALGALLDEIRPSPEERLALVGRAFDAARDALTSLRDAEILDWLEALVKTLQPRDVPDHGEAFFAPHQDCAQRLRQLFGEAERSVEICVFTITDNSLARAILGAHRRGVAVRIVTDDEKIFDLGSDIDRLRGEGVAVRTDSSEDHMHHKFALFDRRLLVTGSYNWTRSAAERNRENIALTDDRRLVVAFGREFDRLWAEFEP